jgi:hypothetical protein
MVAPPWWIVEMNLNEVYWTLVQWGGSAVMARQQASPSNSNPGLDCRSRVCLHYDHVQELLVIDEVVGVLGVLARIELNPVNLTVEFSATPRRGPSCAAIQSGDNQN